MVGLAVIGHSRQGHNHTVPASVITQADWWTVQTARHVARLDAHRLQIEAHLVLSLDPDRQVQDLELTLNPGLQIERAALAGQPLPWQRQGEIVRLALPTLSASHSAASPLGLGDHLRRLARAVAGGLCSCLEYPGSGAQINQYIRETVSYADRTTLQWFRDSDWLIWPSTSQLQVAAQDHYLEISLPPDLYDVIVYPPGPDREEGARLQYTWQGSPPSLLLLAGDYREHPLGDQWSVFAGSRQDQSALADATRILDITERLASWQGQPAAYSHVAYFPFEQRVHLASPWVAAPAEPGSAYDTDGLHLAVLVTESWLREQIAWQPTPFPRAACFGNNPCPAWMGVPPTAICVQWTWTTTSSGIRRPSTGGPSPLTTVCIPPLRVAVTFPPCGGLWLWP